MNKSTLMGTTTIVIFEYFEKIKKIKIKNCQYILNIVHIYLYEHVKCQENINN